MEIITVSQARAPPPSTVESLDESSAPWRVPQSSYFGLVVGSLGLLPPSVWTKNIHATTHGDTVWLQLIAPIQRASLPPPHLQDQVT